MAGSIIEVTDDSFQAEVLESESPILVDFWAPWCAPCRAIAPVLEEIADRITLTLAGDEELLDAARVHEAYLSGEVLAVAVRYSANGAGQVASIDGHELRIALDRA